MAWLLTAIRVKKKVKMHKVFIIAEAGVNHNGSLRTAKKMIDGAVRAGADAVKFQTFNAESMVSRYAQKAGYQKRAADKNENQLEMIKDLELDLKAHKELLRYCREKKIVFLSSPFDLKSVDLLACLGLSIFKIPSGEINNLPYLRKIGSLRAKIIMSTGMSNLKEIKNALDILAASGTKNENITVLHCNTEYPTPFTDVNLSAMLTIKNTLGVQVGYSDHTVGIEVAIAAAALGAKVIEKHFTLGKNMPGPDHAASLDLKELGDLVTSIRNIEMALGSGIKSVSPSEAINMSAVRKSIVAARDIKRGEFFNENNLAVKRPGLGINPMKWDNVLGEIAKKDFNQDEFISL
jgi:N,N'-diacetyllegionaminate synthase